jgi:hypothetical protein
MKSDFRPPRDNTLVIRLMQRLAPLIGRFWRQVVAICIREEDLARLRELRDERFLLCANHPTLGDPVVVMELSRRLGMTFNFMAARELFSGPLGWLLQRSGVYSVLRGAANREAMRCTRRLLAEEDRKVVVFPEGVTYEHNDLLLPFNAGMVQIGFWVLEDLEKLGKKMRLPIVPVAIKYLTLGDARPAITIQLAALERALGAAPAAGQDLYGRLRMVGERVLERMEKEFGLSVPAEAPLSGRIAAAKEHVLTRVARELDVRPPAGASPAERMHFLDNAVAAYVAEYAHSEIEYERRLHQRRREVAEPLKSDLQRLHNFLAVSDEYVATGTTVERFLEVLGRLEVEVLGRPALRLPTRALLRVGEILELGEFYDEYRQSKRAAVSHATAALQNRIQELLQPLSELGTPL